VVSDAAADDLGLRVTPFELAYDLSREVVVEADSEPFDPKIEAERAARVVIPPEKKDAYLGEVPLVTIEPLFTTLPSAERREWWRNHFEERRAAAKRSDPHIELPHWLNAVLKGGVREAAVTGWVRAHDALPEALASRPLLTALPEEERQRILDSLPPLSEPMYTYSPCVWDFTHTGPFIRAALGALSPEEARQVLEDIPQQALEKDYWVTPLAALLLSTPEERVEFVTRHKLRILTWTEVVPWLIATGRHGLDLLRSEISSEGRGPEEAMAFARSVAAVAHGPGMAPFFLDLLDTKVALVATEWLNHHIPEALKAHLTPARAERLKPTLRTLTAEQLRDLLPGVSESTRATVVEVLAEMETSELPADTGWWVEAATSLPKPPAVSFDLAMLPPLVVEGHRLSAVQVGEVVQALSTDTDHPLVTAVRDRAEVTSRDRFAVAVFRAWLASGAVARQSWCLTGAGWLGDSQFVAELTPLIRQWPGQSQHQRAVKGLTALRNVATDAALQAISGIAAKVKFAALKKRAGEAMDEIAAQRGFTRDELEDRILADGGLDERGTRVFSYGSRRFLAFVAPDGKIAARLLDAQDRPTGKVLTSLPAPNKSDDPERAKESKAAYAGMKKDLTALVKVQTSRFEQAMIQDRRWTPADHAAFIAPHPVLRRLLAGVIWAIRDGDGTLVATARIDEDATLIDTDDDPITVPEGGSIGIVHRLDLTDEKASAWGEVLADYELTTPFKQLDRPTFTLPTSQGEKLELQGIPEGKIPAAKLIGAFGKYGWLRGNAYDAGVYSVHYLPVPTANLTIVAHYEDGMWMGSLAEQEDQLLVEVYVVAGVQEADDLGWGDPDEVKDLTKLPWTHVPAKIASEVLATIHQMGG
ncbi:DUF4132 domain-containing protein, partial [Arachnia propionica]